MGAADAVCPHCGYNFPVEGIGSPGRRKSFAHSKAADIILLLATVAAGIGCLVMAVAGIAAVIRDNLEQGVHCAFALVLLAGLLIVFLRVSND